MQNPILPMYSDNAESVMRYRCNNNVFNVSSLREVYWPVDSTGFAIKFVAKGEERYCVEGEDYYIKSGQYLLMSGAKNARVTIDSTLNVKGICVSICPDVVSNTVASLISAGSAYPDASVATFFEADHFLENHYQSGKTAVGMHLEQISNSISNGNFLEQYINEELFFNLAQQVVMDQIPVFKQLQNIGVVKRATQKDLYRRLLRGKEYIDANFTEPIHIASIAREACMSDFHFFRLFKNVFLLSPHQYVLQLRLEHSMVLLVNGMPVTSTALACGFSDIFSFSKSFKKRFGCSPSAIKGK